MPSLPPRKFHLHESVKINLNGTTKQGKIAGYEDGRNLNPTIFSSATRNGPFPGWAYFVILVDGGGGRVGEVTIGEEDVSS